MILTKDAGFTTRRKASRSGPAVVRVRLGNTTSSALLERLVPVIPEIAGAIAAGETLIEVR